MSTHRKAYASALLGGVLVSLAALATSCSGGGATPTGATSRPDAGARSDAVARAGCDDTRRGRRRDRRAARPDAAVGRLGGRVDRRWTRRFGRPHDAGAPVSTTPQPLVPTSSFYPRAILLENGTILASVVATQASGRLGATILESDDDAVSFHVVGNIDDTRMAGGLCCGTLYELPSAIGAIPAGALFWAASLGQGQSAAPMTITVWLSTDRGRLGRSPRTRLWRRRRTRGRTGCGSPSFRCSTTARWSATTPTKPIPLTARSSPACARATE